MSQSRPRVFIVEDEQLTAAGSRHYLDSKFDVIGTADNVTDAVAMIRRREPDLVLLDLRIREGCGADVINEVRATHPDIKFVVLTVSTSRRDVTRLLDIGVDGYLTKGAVGPDLPDRVTEALAGRRPISREVAGFMLDIDDDATEAAGLEQLTLKERQVVVLIARGYSYRETAANLGITVKTLENHMRHIFEKLGIASRYELAALAYKTGFVDHND